MARGFKLKGMISSTECTPQWIPFLTDKTEMELSLSGFLNILIPSLRASGSTADGADVHTDQ